MSSYLLDILTATDREQRDQPIDAFSRNATLTQLLDECEALERFRRESRNLYQQVRACFFLYAIHRFYLPCSAELSPVGHVPFNGYQFLLERRFEQAIDAFLDEQKQHGPSDGLSSALAAAYHRLAFQTLADQVRRSVRSVRGNQWMFRIGHPHDQPLHVRPELLTQRDGAFPILKETTPVRMDLTHSAWSDIFFLGMDFPEGARVLNVSIDLAVRDPETGISDAPRPPVEAYFRVIDEPVLRLTSVDLGATADISSLNEVFDFGRDYLGLLKAAIVAAGVVPPGLEGSEAELRDLLQQLVGAGRGIELISNVHNIPKGSRLAVSTNLLAALISTCMRATGQMRQLQGGLEENERRLVAARAILGEWIGGSGGGWQDSGGVWPGIKLIEGQLSGPDDPEWNISRGRLLPGHRVLNEEQVSNLTRQKLQDSLVLVHGGLAQNVGPILEMVTEKYLLRSPEEWQARAQTGQILDGILQNLQEGDIHALGAATTHNFFGPLQAIVPWSSNLYTETLIKAIQEKFGDDFWGFWMLGGMSGGGMGFIFDPARKSEAQSTLQALMTQTAEQLQHALPYAMRPVVYDFAINERGTWGEVCEPASAPLPANYYAITMPTLMRLHPRDLSATRRAEMDAFARACRTRPDFNGMIEVLFDRLLPPTQKEGEAQHDLWAHLESNGFDAVQHEQIRHDLRTGRIGLAQNRLPVNTEIRDVEAGDVRDGIDGLTAEMRTLGVEALQRGEVAVLSLAAGVGSRWTQGAGVVKALHPFAKFAGRHRTFLETHLAKSRRISQMCGTTVPHIFTTSYLTHKPIADFLAQEENYRYSGPVLLSTGRSIGLRLVPTVRDLRFAWEETAQQTLDEQAQKMRRSTQAALMEWARQQEEASDYTDNTPLQCLHPVGHWYEIPSLLRNGMLHDLLQERPQLKYLMLHNIDTLGADVDPSLLGMHIQSGSTLSFEVIRRRLDDRGGGLARVDGRLRLVEGLAMPREEAEFSLSYYNSMTTWIDIDALLEVFNLSRDTLADENAVTEGIRAVAARMPTYVTLKDVKRRWGHGHEDVFPVLQWEKLWSDMTAVSGLSCQFIAVPRLRGQQLKEQAQLDGWLRDGSAAYVDSLCEWS
jgi:hypothetical protein